MIRNSWPTPPSLEKKSAHSIENHLAWKSVGIIFDLKWALNLLSDSRGSILYFQVPLKYKQLTRAIAVSASRDSFNNSGMSPRVFSETNALISLRALRLSEKLRQLPIIYFTSQRVGKSEAKFSTERYPPSKSTVFASASKMSLNVRR